MKGPRHQQAATDAEYECREDAYAQSAKDLRGQQVCVGVRVVAIDQYREHGPHGVVDNALPTEQCGGALLEIGLLEQRHDHGRTGHDDDRTEYQCHRPSHVGEVVCRGTTEHEGEQGVPCHEARDRSAVVAQLVPVQVEATFEQDHGDAERDDRLQQVTEVLRRLQPAGQRAEKHADGDQQNQRRYAQTPTKPLRRDTRDQYRSE